MQQLDAFGFHPKDIENAMQNIPNPEDINQVIEFITNNDMGFVLKTPSHSKENKASKANTKRKHKKTDSFEAMYGMKGGATDSDKKLVINPENLMIETVDGQIYGEEEDVDDGETDASSERTPPPDASSVAISISIRSPSKSQSRSKSQSQSGAHAHDEEKRAVFGTQPILLTSTLMADSYGAPIPDILIKLKVENVLFFLLCFDECSN